MNGDNAELKSGKYDIGRASHRIILVISRDPSIMNFCRDAGIERESIYASLYHHSTVPQIQEKQLPALNLDF